MFNFSIRKQTKNMFRIKVSINYVENKQKKSKVNNPKADSF